MEYLFLAMMIASALLFHIRKPKAIDDTYTIDSESYGIGVLFLSIYILIFTKVNSFLMVFENKDIVDLLGSVSILFIAMALFYGVCASYCVLRRKTENMIVMAYGCFMSVLLYTFILISTI